MTSTEERLDRLIELLEPLIVHIAGTYTNRTKVTKEQQLEILEAKNNLRMDMVRNSISHSTLCRKMNIDKGTFSMWLSNRVMISKNITIDAVKAAITELVEEQNGNTH